MGAEGRTDDAGINNLRERQTRNFLATLMLSQGVPMLAGGDEVARSQQGNNNCYCQDNELTWFDWAFDPPRDRLRNFTGQLIKLRLAHPNLHRRKFFQDRQIRQAGEDILVKDIAWFNSDSSQVSDEVWNAGWNRSIALLLNGQTLQIIDEAGKPIIDDSFLLIVNASPEGVEFRLPASPSGKNWNLIMDTENIQDPFAERDLGDSIIAGGRSFKLLSDNNSDK
jgi:isoamylase